MDNNNSWQSGIKFTEEKKSKRFMRSLSIILIAFFSASIGGVAGGFYVKKNLDNSYYGSYKDGSNINSTTILNDNVLSENPKSISLPKNSITKVAELVGPAIVGIDNNVRSWQGGSALGGSGSGIIFDKRGYIVTNEEAVDNASKITITLPGGRKVVAKLIGKDSKTDLAVLKIDAKNLPIAKFGNSESVRVGDVAVAIGNPLGEEFSGAVTVGIISALNKSIDVDGKDYRVIQTDASINAGNSGGALCNEVGEVIGINSNRFSSPLGIGFAISINEARPIIEAIMKNGYVSRPSFGIVSEFIDESDSKYYDVPIGVYVQKVINVSKTTGSSLEAGDIILELDTSLLKTGDDLSSIIDKHKIGDIIKAKVWRNKKNMNLKLLLVDSYGQ